MLKAEKEDIIDKTLKIKGCSLLELQRKLSTMFPNNVGIIAYMSALEGLGTVTSDVDVYVIERNTGNKGNVVQKEIGGVILDVESWDEDELLSIYDGVISEKNDSHNFLKLKVLMRLKQGVSLTNIFDSELFDKLNSSKLETIITNGYASLARSHYDDARKMIKSSELVLALDELRRATWFAAAALSAQRGHANLKEKWITKVFLNSPVSDELKEQYTKLQIFPSVNEKNLPNVVDELSGFVSNLFFELIMGE